MASSDEISESNHTTRKNDHVLEDNQEENNKFTSKLDNSNGALGGDAGDEYPS
nr:hypothetical protein [Tanacetum cinerariifolium]